MSGNPNEELNEDLFVIYKIKNSENKNYTIPGYFVVSTAPYNVEDREEFSEEISEEDRKDLERVNIEEVAKQLYSKANAEVAIAIHGYNTGYKSAKEWYKTIHSYANDNLKKDNCIFIGYRWPSENLMPPTIDILPGRIKDLFAALPILFVLIFVLGIIGTVSGFLLLKQFLLTGSVFFVSIVVTLILLRSSVYFRDSFRANNYAIPDLVELIRQLHKIVKNEWKNGPEDRKKRIKLSFICHSMGAFVATNAIRIISDVFDPNSIGTLNSNDPQKLPSSEIGDVFSLGRLVLVAPDIPVDTITSGRANFLRSSLRRFEETYVFSNKGDLALRLASTAANYFSFPARTRLRGYRLGNVTVDSKSNPTKYGIVNLSKLLDVISDRREALAKYLNVSILFQKQITLSGSQFEGEKDLESIADLFTYFDCTDYTDYKINNSNSRQRIVSFSLNLPDPLNLFVYVKLLLAWNFKKIDVHGGYFEGDFSSKIIYKLAFLSFGGFLESAISEEIDRVSQEELEKLVESDRVISQLENQRRALREKADPESIEQLKRLEKNPLDVVKKRLMALAILAKECEDKKILTVLSPERYKVDILLDRSREECRSAMLNVKKGTQSQQNE